MGKQKDERFEQIGSKIDPAMAEVLNACCDSLGVDVYHLIQWFCYVIVRAASPTHNLDPRIQKLMTLLDTDAGWQNAFNLCNPDKLKVAQVILILEQANHKGFGAVMVDRPFMDKAPDMVDGLDPKRADPQMTLCVDDILERVLEVTMRGIYRRLRMACSRISTEHFSDVLLTMLDAQELIDAEASEREEGPQMGTIADNGKPMEFGKRTKRKKHFTPDNMPVTGYLFDDFDRHPLPVGTTLEDWEGEHSNNDRS